MAPPFVKTWISSSDRSVSVSPSVSRTWYTNMCVCRGPNAWRTANHHCLKQPTNMQEVTPCSAFSSNAVQVVNSRRQDRFISFFFRIGIGGSAQTLSRSKGIPARCFHAPCCQVAVVVFSALLPQPVDWTELLWWCGLYHYSHTIVGGGTCCSAARTPCHLYAVLCGC